MKKILLILTIIVCIFPLNQCSNKESLISQENTINIAQLQDDPTAKNVIKSYIDALNNKNSTDSNKYIASNKISSDLRLTNLNHIEIENITLIKEPSIYNDFINQVNEKTILAYLVNCNITYNDDSIEPIKNGNYDYIYILNKENNSWKILDIGRT
ncbi:MAG: DUF4829 domain-containing protein [Sarcina sp.]